MMTNAAKIAELKREWEGVIKMRERMRLLVVATFAGGAITGRALADVMYNLPVLLAFDVLGQALTAMRDEKLFACPRKFLGDLMDGSKSALPWIQFNNLRDGVRRRNEIAHDGMLFDSVQCLQDIASIEEQLVAWSIIDKK